MSDTPEQDTHHQKKLYVKPKLWLVQLRAEEAVLGNCKTSSSGGPVQSTCNSPSACSSQGS